MVAMLAAVRSSSSGSEAPRGAGPTTVATIVEFEGKRPHIAGDAWIAPTALLIGDVCIEAEASMWFGAVLRRDFARIEVEPGSCVQDNAMVHAAEDLPTIIGPGAIVGHVAILEGCTIQEGGPDRHREHREEVRPRRSRFAGRRRQCGDREIRYPVRCACGRSPGLRKEAARCSAAE